MAQGPRRPAAGLDLLGARFEGGRRGGEPRGRRRLLSKGRKGETLPEVVNRPRDGQRAWLLDFEEDGSGIALRVRIEGADLTVKQKEVLALVAGRRTNSEIAEELQLSVNAVKTHVREILRELEL